MVNKQQAVEKDLLEKLMGSMKRYQWVITLSCYLIQILIPFHCTSHGLMVPATTPIYCSNTNLTIKDVPTIEELNELYNEACSEDCPEIVVSKKYYDLTIVHQFKLYCNGRDKFTTAAQMIVMFGILIGNLLFGWLADAYGRKTILIVCALMQAPMGVAVAFAPDIYSFLVFKFVLNLFVGGAMVTAFVLFSECDGMVWRPICGLFSMLPYTMGYLALAGLAYIFRDWRYFQLTLSLPALLLLFYIWVLPESPRWLLAVGKVDKGIKEVEFIARKNRLPVSNIRAFILADLEEKKTRTEQPLRKGKFTDLFQSCRMSLVTIFTWINWFAIVGCFYGVAQYSAGLGSNIYQSFLYGAITQTPSLLIAFYTLTYWGRRWTFVFTNLLACLSILAVYFTPIGDYQVIPASICLLALAMAFPCIYVYSSELFPTPVRNIGMGTSSAIARVGAMLAALIVDLRRVAEWIPPVIFAFALGLSLVGFIFLPETKGIILPSSVKSTEKLRTLSTQLSRGSLGSSHVLPKDMAKE